MNRTTRILRRMVLTLVVVGSLTLALVSGLAYSDRLDYQKGVIASLDTAAITNGPVQKAAVEHNVVSVDEDGFEALTLIAVAVDIDPLGTAFSDTALSGSVRDEVKDAADAYGASLTSRVRTSILDDDIANMARWCSDDAATAQISFLQGTDGLVLRGFTPEQARKERDYRVAYEAHFEKLKAAKDICPTFK